MVHFWRLGKNMFLFFHKEEFANGNLHYAVIICSSSLISFKLYDLSRSSTLLVSGCNFYFSLFDSLLCKADLTGVAEQSLCWIRCRNGKTLVCGGKSNFLHVYSLHTHKLLHVIQLPSTVQCVKQLDFLVDKFDSGENMVSESTLPIVKISVVKLWFGHVAIANWITLKRKARFCCTRKLVMRIFLFLDFFVGCW